MKTTKQMAIALAAIGLLACGVTAAQAQVITWSTPQQVDPTSESNVSTTGTELDGIQTWASGSTITLANGVVFDQTTTSGSNVSDTSGDIVITDATNYGDYFLGNTGTFTDPSYSSLLHLALVLGGSGTLTFNNLTANHVYQVELWSSGDGAAHPEWGIDLAGSTPVGLSSQVGSDGPGTLVIGTFTATGTSMTEDFSQSDYGTSTDLNGLTPTDYNAIVIGAAQIRDLGLAETPEPSTVALIGLGALGIAFLIRRRIA